MSGRGAIWRSILWFERFLPTPKAASSGQEQAVERRRRAFVPLVVLLTVVLPTFLRSRHEFGALLRSNIALFQQLFLGFVIVCALAIVVAGLATWRREVGR